MVDPPERDPFATTRATYDLIHTDYEARSGADPKQLGELRGAVADLLDPGSLLADVGCGPGRDAVYFASRDLSVLGLDASVAMAARTRSRGVTTVLGDLRSLPLAAGRLDAVWSAASLVHVPSADVPATLRGFRRALRYGGVLGLSTAVGDVEGWEEVRYVVDPGVELIRPLRRWFVHHRVDDLLDLVRDAGFEVRSATEVTSHRRWVRVLATAS